MMATREVKVYSTPMCPWCKRAKQFLEDNGVEYRDLNVAEDGGARDEMIERSGQMGVPTILIGDEVVVGFDEALLREKLGL